MATWSTSTWQAPRMALPESLWRRNHCPPLSRARAKIRNRSCGPLLYTWQVAERIIWALWTWLGSCNSTGECVANVGIWIPNGDPTDVRGSAIGPEWRYRTLDHSSEPHKWSRDRLQRGFRSETLVRRWTLRAWWNAATVSCAPCPGSELVSFAP